ncbi:hypothetical protein QUV58_02225 [Succinatimonas hippei]|nr:hypothetical protein [Succinatimonas hippei]MDM8119623.1 hypothetical protein [Succinatimonas hippei]
MDIKVHVYMPIVGKLLQFIVLLNVKFYSYFTHNGFYNLTKR